MGVSLEQVMEYMFREREYPLLSIDDVLNVRMGEGVSLEGNILAYIHDENGMFDFGDNEKEPITAVYSRMLGISPEKFIGLCKILYENNIKAKVYGKMEQDNDNEKDKVLEVYKIEFVVNNVKKEYPDVELVEQASQRFPEIIDFIDYQKREKDFIRQLKTLEKGPEKNEIMKAYAELEIYRLFLDTKYELEKKMLDNAPKITIVDFDNDIEVINTVDEL